MEDPPWDRTVFNVTLKFRRWLSVIRRDETRSVSQRVSILRPTHRTISQPIP